MDVWSVRGTGSNPQSGALQESYGQYGASHDTTYLTLCWRQQVSPALLKAGRLSFKQEERFNSGQDWSQIRRAPQRQRARSTAIRCPRSCVQTLTQRAPRSRCSGDPGGACAPRDSHSPLQPFRSLTQHPETPLFVTDMAGASGKCSPKLCRTSLKQDVRAMCDVGNCWGGGRVAADRVGGRGEWLFHFNVWENSLQIKKKRKKFGILPLLWGSSPQLPCQGSYPHEVK